MKRNLTNLFTVLGGLFLSSLAFAQEGTAAATTMGGGGLVAVGSALAIGLAALGGTMGQGRAAGAALSGIARNPTAADKVFTPMIIALALIEFQAIMGFIIAYILSGKV
ncbi:MAG: ATP synthase F0 subunit C [Chitinophagaceae bacterium]|nr:ATP synthase F0 subunit C [Oligoflexus sp.]